MQVPPPASQPATLQPIAREESRPGPTIEADSSSAGARSIARANHPLSARRMPAVRTTAAPTAAARADAPMDPAAPASTPAVAAPPRTLTRAALSGAMQAAQRATLLPPTVTAEFALTDSPEPGERTAAPAPPVQTDQSLAASQSPAVQLLRQGRFEESLAVLEQHLQVVPHDGVAQICKSYVLQRLGRWQAALDGFDAVVAAQSATPAVHMGRALSLHALGEHSQAILAADGVPATSPAHLLAAKIKATALCNLGQVQAGADVVDEAVRTNPDSPLPYLVRAEIALHGQVRRPDLALVDIANAIERTNANSRDYPATLGKLGSLLLATGNPAEALLVFDKAATMHPNDYACQLGLGKTLAALQHPERSLPAFDTAVALEPGRSEPRHARGHALVALGRYAEAAQDFRALAASDPHAPMPKFALAAVLIKQACFDEALDLVDQGLRIVPDHAEAHGVRALALGGMASAAHARSAELLAAREQ